MLRNFLMRAVTPFPAMSSLLRLTKRSNLDRLILTIRGWKNVALHHKTFKNEIEIFCQEQSE